MLITFTPEERKYMMGVMKTFYAMSGPITKEEEIRLLDYTFMASDIAGLSHEEIKFLRNDVKLFAMMVRAFLKNMEASYSDMK
jgi:hypothetical protein